MAANATDIAFDSRLFRNDETVSFSRSHFCWIHFIGDMWIIYWLSPSTPMQTGKSFTTNSHSRFGSQRFIDRMEWFFLCSFFFFLLSNRSWITAKLTKKKKREEANAITNRRKISRYKYNISCFDWIAWMRRNAWVALHEMAMATKQSH